MEHFKINFVFFYFIFWGHFSSDELLAKPNFSPTDVGEVENNQSLIKAEEKLSDLIIQCFQDLQFQTQRTQTLGLTCSIIIYTN